MGIPSAEPAAATSLDRVRAAVASLERAVRSHGTWAGEGATFAAHLADLEKQVGEIVAEGSIGLRVSSFGLVYDGRPLHPPERCQETWFDLFAEGVREITFLPEVGPGELRTFVEVLCSEPDAGEDRLTMLWRRGVHGIQLYVASMLAVDMEVDEHGDLRLPAALTSTALLGSDESGARTGLAFAPDDPRSLQDGGDLGWLEDATSPPFVPDAGVEHALARARAVGGAVERTLDAAAGAPLDEPIPPLIHAWLISLSHRAPGGPLLEALEAIGRRPDAIGERLRAGLCGEVWTRRLAPLCDAAPEAFREAIGLLARQDDDFLRRLRLLLNEDEARELFAQLAGETGADMVPFYVEHLESGDEKRAVAAVDGLAAMTTDEAATALGAAMSHKADAVRYRAIRALGGRYDPRLRNAVLGTIRDPRRVVRVLGLAVLAQAPEPAVCRALLGEVDTPAFLQRDAEEKATWFRTLAHFDLPEIMDHFGRLLGTRSVARRKGVAEAQLLAVRGLAQAGTPPARSVLEGARGSWSLARAVKRAIEEALDSWEEPT